MVTPIGGAPAVNRYYVQNGNLMMDQRLQGSMEMPVAASIVQLQAQYGKDTDADGAIDTWDEVTPNAANGWAPGHRDSAGPGRRSALPERPDPATGACTTTTVPPTWSVGDLDVSADPNWRCYRYRVFESTISLRNMVWRPT